MMTNPDELRRKRGQEIAETCEIRKGQDGWIVPSQSASGTYTVRLEGFEPICSCLDFEMRKSKCKHIFAVEFSLRQEIDTNGNMTTTKTVKMTYPQDWENYDRASTNQKLLFLKLLNDLCDNVSHPLYEFGRPKLPYRDLVFASILKVFTTFSLRRFVSDMEIAKEMKLVSVTPCYASVGHFMQKEELTPILKELIQLSSLPLKSVEKDFAVDGTGFSTCRFDRWFNYKYGKEVRTRRWVKAHVICGVKTNIITDVEVTKGKSNDSPFLPNLVKRTAENFNMEEVSADKAYLGRRNFQAIEEAGAMPFVPLKRNVHKFTRANGVGIWKKMAHYFLYKNEEFMQHYHKRSNVETTFHMIKTKFGDAVRSKTFSAQTNEVLCKVLCHNLCVVIQEMFELGIQGKF